MDPAEDTDEDGLLDYDVQMIIQESCQMNQLTTPCRSDITETVSAGDVLALQELCDFPAAFGQVDKHGWYPLHWAAVQPLSSTSQERFQHDWRCGWMSGWLSQNIGRYLLNDQTEFKGVMDESVRSGCQQMVSALLVRGARVGQICLKKWTAMHEASKAGCVHIMELLLNRGGQVAETDQHGVTPLGIAAEYSHPEVLELLIKHGDPVKLFTNSNSVLYDAAGSGNPDCINILLQHGANPNIHNLSFQLPIHRAAYEGHYLALRILIPITTRRALRLSGQSPVHSAADGGHTHCLELLLQDGFDANALLAPHISDNYGDMRRSPLYFAVSNGDTASTELLLKSGAKPDLDPLRCLLVAVRSGRYEIVKLLLTAKADVNCYFTAINNTVFPTALLYCLKDEVMMRMLLNNGYSAENCFCCYHDDDWDDPNDSIYSKSQEEKAAVSYYITFCDFISVSWLASLAGRVVSILLEYVGQVSLCGKLTNILEKHKEWPHIHTTIYNPRSLSHLSRVVIRRHLCYSRLASVELPNRLKDYLLFKDKDLYAKIVCKED
uniref:Ankyrin repeat and SOCS box containing 15a n=1 Tax=Sphaeramia orbicularis TaxID=375764 RepID=A0A673B683_9TELE